MRRGDRRQPDETIGRGVNGAGIDRTETIDAWSSRLQRRIEPAGQGGGLTQAQGGFQNTDVHPRLPAHQCRQGADKSVQSAQHLRRVALGRCRWPVRQAKAERNAGERLYDNVMTMPGGVGPGHAKPGQAQADRVAGSVREAPVKRRHRLRCLTPDDQASARRVGKPGQGVGKISRRRLAFVQPQVKCARRLVIGRKGRSGNLDDLGAEAPHQPAAVAHPHTCTGFDHVQAVQRLGLVWAHEYPPDPCETLSCTGRSPRPAPRLPPKPFSRMQNAPRAGR